jgi:hypothetical protein
VQSKHQPAEANETFGIIFSKFTNIAFWVVIIWLAARLLFNMGVDEGKRLCAAGECNLAVSGHNHGV